MSFTPVSARTQRVFPLLALFVLGVGLAPGAQQPAGQAPAGQTSATPAAPGTAGPGRSTNLGTDPNGNPLRLALKTGHVSNYDESKVPPYKLPDPLVTADGKPVKDASTWRNTRRPELLMEMEQIYAELAARPPVVGQSAGQD